MIWKCFHKKFINKLNNSTSIDKLNSKKIITENVTNKKEKSTLFSTH